MNDAYHPNMIHETNSVQETQALGMALGKHLQGGMVIGLAGPLGAGKTQLVKGIAVGNGLADDNQVTSPTFTLVHEYAGKVTLYHLDAYRLESVSALLNLGFDEMMHDDAVLIVEWADRVSAAMPDDTVWISLVPTGEQQRRVEFRGRAELIHVLINGDP